MRMMRRKYNLANFLRFDYDVSIIYTRVAPCERSFSKLMRS